MNNIDDLFQNIKKDIMIARGTPSLNSFNNSTNDYSVDNSVEIKNYSYIKSWFQPHVIEELTIIKNYIDMVKNPSLHDFFFVGFLGILRGVSDTSSGFGNLMINKNPPKKERIFEKFSKNIMNMSTIMQEFGNNIEKDTKVDVNCMDSRNLESIPDNSVDMICTHPPYMASVPYAEYQKLSLWWAGLSPKNLDKELIGGRRSRADTAERFILDMRDCFDEMYRVMKNQKYCCVVIGNPVYRGKTWHLNQILKETGSNTGFKFLKEIVRGKYRTTMGKMKEEYILIFRK